MDLLATARRLEAIQAEVVRTLAAESEPVAGGWMAANGRGSYLNKAVGLGFEQAPTADDLARVNHFFGSRGIEPKVELTVFASQAFLRLVAESGFVLREFENVLVLPLAAVTEPHTLLPAGWPAEVRIERVDPGDPARLDAFVRTGASGFLPEGQPISDEWLQTGLRAARSPGNDSYLAWVGDQVAGAGGCGTLGGVTSLFGTSVLPRFRRRGIQQALMAVRLGRAKELRSDLAAITSHPGIPTERNAVRLGFRMAYARAVLARPGPGLTPSP